MSNLTDDELELLVEDGGYSPLYFEPETVDDFEPTYWVAGMPEPAAPAPRGRYDCPTCKRADVLTRYEAAHGYQCRQCTRRDAGEMGDY